MDKHYVFIVYNSLTLCKALYYCERNGLKQNADIIFNEGVLKTPEKLRMDYNVYSIAYKYDPSKQEHFQKIIYVLKENYNAIKARQILSKIIRRNRNNELYLYIFKDRSVREATCIECLHKLKQKNGNVIMVEEGYGLYNYNVTPMSLLHKTINYIMGVSTYPCIGLPYGLHPLLNFVICNSPILLKRKYHYFNYNNVEVLQQENIFDDYYCQAYFKYLSDQFHASECKYEFVFLTIPWDDGCLSCTEEEYCKFLKQLFDALSDIGNVLIKRHPRDNYDYSIFKNNNVYFKPEYDIIPFEALYSVLGRPIMVAITSSCCACDKDKKSYYLSGAFPNLNAESNDYLLDNNIEVCSSIHTLIRSIKKDYGYE